MTPLTLTLKKSTAWVVKTSVTIMINNSPIGPIHQHSPGQSCSCNLLMRHPYVDLNSTFMAADMFNRLDARVC